MGDPGKPSSSDTTEYQVTSSNMFGWKKTVFLLVTLLFFVLAAWQILQVVADYMDYPTTSLSHREDVRHMEFPAVTVCSVPGYQGGDNSLSDSDLRGQLMRDVTVRYVITYLCLVRFCGLV